MKLTTASRAVILGGIRSFLRARRTNRSIARLDDHMLRDILPDSHSAFDPAIGEAGEGYSSR